MGYLTLVWQLVKKENSKFKPVKLSFKKKNWPHAEELMCVCIYIYIYIYIYKQKQGDQLESPYSSSVRIRDAALRTCRMRWMIARGGKRGSGISALMPWQDDDHDIYAHTHVRYILIQSHTSLVGWGCRIHRLHLSRVLRPPHWVSWIWH